MKKLFATFICAAVMLVAGVPVYAAENENVPDTAITSGTAEGAEGAIFVEQAAMPPAKLPIVELQPIQVKMEMVGDTPYITKVYELDRTSDLTLMVNGFGQDGYIFTRHDIYEQMQADVVDTRQASQSATVEIADNSTAAVLAAADAIISFSEDGYSGQLQIDANSIHIEEAGRTSYNYRITEVREYANLDRNDANYIPKTITKDGRTLELESIDWQVMGTTNTDGGLVPNNFKATATYAGSATGSQVSGYVATFQYTGLIEKTTQGKCLYSIVYRGEPVEQPSNWPLFALATTFIVCMGGLGVIGFIISVRDHKRLVEESKNNRGSENEND